MINCKFFQIAQKKCIICTTADNWWKGAKKVMALKCTHVKLGILYQTTNVNNQSWQSSEAFLWKNLTKGAEKYDFYIKKNGWKPV